MDRWVQIDTELIRQYNGYWRADAVGLAADVYFMKVVPVINGKLDETQAMISEKINVIAHDRSGYGFAEGSNYKTASGAYNDDGTLRSNAQVVYITAETAKTCKATVNGTVYTGFQTILDAKQKGASTSVDTDPICFRIIGLVT